MLKPFDVVHLAHTTFPEDPRVRRETMISAEQGARVAVVVLRSGRDPRPVSRYGPIAVIRLEGERRRGWAGKYLMEYLDFIYRARDLIRRDPRFRHARVFHIHSLPDFLVAAARPARRHGARVILDLHEVFPEFTRSRFKGPLSSIGGWIAERLEGWSRRQADVTVTVNHAIAEHLRSRPARANERIAVVHNFADPADFGPARKHEANQPPALRLVYHGTLTPLYGLDLAIGAVALAQQEGIDARFDIWGDGPARISLELQITDAGLEDSVRLRGIAVHEQLRSLLTGYDAGFVPTRLDVMTRFSLSTKLLEYIHLGVPALIPRIPTYVRYIPEDSAWYFEPGSVRDAARAIREFSKAGTAEREKRAARAQRWYAERINSERDAETLRRIYGELLGSYVPAGRS
jgi:glycosyltransferase involved in cell wall biosynthesis